MWIFPAAPGKVWKGSLLDPQSLGFLFRQVQVKGSGGTCVGRELPLGCTLDGEEREVCRGWIRRKEESRV